MFRALRQKLVLWNVLVLFLILGALGFAVYTLYSQSIFKEVDTQLDQQASHVVNDLSGPSGQTFNIFSDPKIDPSFRIIVTNLRGDVNVTTDCPYPPPSSYFIECNIPDEFDAASDGALKDVLKSRTGIDTRTVQFRGERVRVLTFITRVQGVMPVIVQISRPVTPEITSLQELDRLLLFGGLAGIVLAGLGSWFLASRALVPIRQAFARQRRFTADASHELRTPLALIRANAEMVLRHGDRLPPADGELVAEIIRETDHLHRLVSDLLTLARADTGQVALSTRPVDFRALVSEVHEDLHYIAESRGISSHVALDGPVIVEGDETRLRQLLLILLDNALKYTDQGGHVDVALRRDDNRARLMVSDTGIGIPAEDLPRIFDRFFRVDRAREHESGGTGLGLAIAKWIVDAHHGTIKAESEVGKGTRFVVDLPATQGEGARAPRPMIRESRSR